jgi:TolA-binding protein
MSRRVPFLLPFLLILTGCPTIWQYNALKERVTSLEEENARLKMETDRANQRLANLDTKYDSRLSDVLGMGAESSARLDELGQEVSRVRGKAEELEFYVNKLREMVDRMAQLMDERFNMNVQAVPEYAPKERKERMAFAQQKFDAGDLRMSRSVFRSVLSDFPNEEGADQAQFMVGETFFAEKKYAEAIREYRAVHDHYRKSPLVLKSLTRIGDSFEASDSCSKALQIYDYARDFAKAKDDKEALAKKVAALKKTCKPR